MIVHLNIVGVMSTVKKKASRGCRYWPGAVLLPGRIGKALLKQENIWAVTERNEEQDMGVSEENSKQQEQK